MNRRAAARDVIVIGIVLFILGIGFFLNHYISTTVVTGMLSASAINQSGSAAPAAINSINTVSARQDYLFLAFFIGLLLSLVITAWFVGGNPIFMFFYFIVIVIAVILCTLLSNIFETFTQQIIFGTTINSLPITNHIISFLPYYVAVVGFVGLVVMFGKPFMQGSSG